MASKEPEKPVLHRKDSPKELLATEEPTGASPTGEKSEEYRRFNEFGRIVFTVPKSEIDAEEKKAK